MTIEKTLAIIKPNITNKSLIGEIINIWEKKGLRIVGMKMVHLTPYEAQSFYKEHEEKPFFESMVNFMCSDSVVVVCLEGENAIKVNREIMGTTNPQEAGEGTIRKIFGESIEANAIHGSDSFQSAQWEIKFFFSEKEIFSRNK